MAEQTDEAKKSVLDVGLRHWVFNIGSALLIAFITYIIPIIGSIAITENCELYFINVTRSAATSKFTKIAVIDNYSRRTIDKVEFSIRGSNLQIQDARHVGKAEASPIGPDDYLITLRQVLPARQITFMLLSDSFVDAASYRTVDAPLGFVFKDKDALRTSLFDIGNAVHALVIFLLYLTMSLYLDMRLARTIGEAKDLGNQLAAAREERNKDGEKRDKEISKLKDRVARNTLVYVKRVVNLSMENEIWRDVFTKSLVQATSGNINAKTIIAIMLKKLGVRAEKIETEDLGSLIVKINELESNFRGDDR